MQLESLRAERRKDGSLGIVLQVSTSPDELHTTAKLLEAGGPAPIAEAVFVEAQSLVRKLRNNLMTGDPPLEGLPDSVRFVDHMTRDLTDEAVYEALASVLRFVKPSSSFIAKVLKAVYDQMEQGGGEVHV